MKDRIRFLEKFFLLWSALLLLSTTSGHLHSPDGEVNYRTTRSVATGGGYAIGPMPDGSLTRRAENGEEYSQYGPLLPLLAAPLYWVGDAAARTIPESWLSAQSERLLSTVVFYRPNDTLWAKPFPGLYPADHAERVRRIFVSSFNSLVTWATVFLLVVWSRSLFGESPIRLVLPVTYLVATWAWPHSRGLYTEPLAIFFILTALYTASRIGEGEADSRPNLVRAVLVGVWSGFAVLARLDSVVALPGILWIACSQILKERKKAEGFPGKSSILLGVLAFTLLASILPLQNYLRYGSVLATGYSDQPEGVAFSIPLFHSLWTYFLSPGKGIFGYSPPLLAALLAWPAFIRRDRTLAIGVVLAILGYVLVVARWQNLGGQCWGPRHLFQVNALLLLPVPFLFIQGKESPIGKIGVPLFAFTFVLGVFVQITGVLVDFMWPLDRLLSKENPLIAFRQTISAAFYGPYLHMQTWRIERTPDWLLADLWRSGEIGARMFSGLVWGTLVAMMLALIMRSLWWMKERLSE
jgi:hypothetical protein